MSIPELRLLVRWSGVALLLGACAHAPDPREQRVRSSYAAAAADPSIRDHASVELYEAKQELDRLQRSVRGGAETVEIDHRAYVAQQRIEIARLAAESAVLEGQTKLLTEDRDRLRLQAREQDVRAAEDRAAAAEDAAADAQDDAEEAHERVRVGELAAAEARTESAEQRASAAERELADLKGKETERGLVLTLDAGLFAVDRTELQSGARAELDRISAFLQTHPGREVRVEGHTDDVGDDRYNVALSERRARVVADHLIARGIDSQRIRVEGLGESRPIAPNDTASGRQQNRRVEVVITQ